MTKGGKIRLDELVVERGLAENRSRARALIMSGAVLVQGRVADKAGLLLSPEAEVSVKQLMPFVSRGGLKLSAALAAFSVNPRGKICLDVGASTGGFTDCLLQAGAEKVYAVDVGRGVLAQKLRQDRRVVVLEGINARRLEHDLFAEEIALATVDVSFISLTLILPRLVPLLEPEGEILALIKPQFEAGRKAVGKGGVVRDPAVILETVEKISGFCRGMGVREVGRTASPVKGPKGNQEYFLHLKK